MERSSIVWKSLQVGGKGLTCEGEVKNAIKHATVHRKAPHHNYPAPNFKTAETKKHCYLAWLYH